MDMDRWSTWVARLLVWGFAALSAWVVWALIDGTGAVGVVLVSPLLGAAVGYVLGQYGLGVLHRSIRRLRHGAVDGHHFAYKGVEVRIQVVRETAWVAVADVLRVIGVPAAERAQVLRRLRIDSPDAFQAGEQGLVWMRSRELIDWLTYRGAQGDGRSTRVLVWLQRDTLPPLLKRSAST